MNETDISRVNATTLNGVVVNMEDYKAAALAKRATGKSINEPSANVNKFSALVFALALLAVVFFGFAR